MKYLSLITVFIFASCANNQQVLDSNFSNVKASNTGVLLTVDLNTSGKIKRGKQCNLIIAQNQMVYKVPLKEGSFNYALSLIPGQAKLQELTCGPFYYYKINDQGAQFSVSNGKVTYLGTLDFILEDEGKMTWGPSTKSKRLLESHLGEMGMTEDEVIIEPLRL